MAELWPGGRPDECDNDRVMGELRRRLVPEGMEWLVEAWPRFEDGEPVRVGDEFMGKDGKTYTVKQIRFMGCYFSLYDFCDDKPQFKADYGERVKRPAPKVLDADGAEIELGDDLYSVEGGLKFHVSHIDRVSNRIATDAMFALDKWADPSMYTHRAPVLAADGRPLREGETVWDVLGKRQFTVLEIGPDTMLGGYNVNTVGVDGMGLKGWSKPSDLTHERPDSWERLEEDVASASCPDVYCANHHIDASDASYEWAMARDIVRRAKKLAGDA